MAEKTLLQIVQEFCKRRALPVPPVAAAATDDTTVQIVALMNEGIQNICDRYELQQLTQLATFTHVGGPDYLALDFANANPDWKFTLKDTLWNTTNRIPVAGPLTMKDWMVITTMKMAAAQYQWTLYGNGIHIFPAPAPLNAITFGFYYQSKFGVLDGTTTFESYQTDASTPLLPTYIIEADLAWRWKEAKGLPYAEAMRACEAMIIDMIGRGPNPALNLNGAFDSTEGPSPGIFVQPGSWPV